MTNDSYWNDPEPYSSRKTREQMPTEGDVHLAYRGWREAQAGHPVSDAEYEATFSRVEFAWMRAALTAAYPSMTEAARAEGYERGNGDGVDSESFGRDS